jgi:hypothetical protein
MSALPPKADMVQHGRDVRFVALCQKRTHAPQQFRRYSITESATPISGCGDLLRAFC